MIKKKWLIIGSLAFVIVILAISLTFLIIDKINSATISVTIAPSIATVKIDGKEYSAIGTYKMPPGEYDVEISADGFQTKTQKLIALDNETTSLLTYLDPTDENSDWYDTHEEDALIMGETKNAQTIEVVQKLVEDNPILSKLPYVVEYYTDDYGTKYQYTISYELIDADSKFKIMIKDYMGNGRDLAMKWLRENTSETALSNVEYIDLSDDDLSARP